MVDVSVLVPCYKRPDDLKRCLTELRLQVVNFSMEIVVVDDGTPDDSVQDAAAEFEEIRYEKAPNNLGLIGARNYGAARCGGQFIVNLDDDSWFESTTGMQMAIDRIRQDSTIGVLALNVNAKGRGYLWKIEGAAVELSTYIGCGNIYRRSVLEIVGPYIGEFYRQGEESERCMRIIDAGFRIVSAPDIPVYHDESPVNRNRRRNVAWTAANYLRREALRAPFPYILTGSARAVLYAIRRIHRLDHALYFKEMLHRDRPIWLFFGRLRRPVSTSTYRKWQALANQGSVVFRAREREING